MDTVIFSPIDEMLAELLTKNCSNQLKTFLSYLSVVTRSGHLCLKIEENTLSPAPEEVIEGSFSLDLSSSVIQGSKETLPSIVIQKGNSFYFERFYNAQEKVFAEWKRLSSAIVETLSFEEHNFSSLNLEQRTALQMAGKSAAFLLTGGPGTGKTYTASLIVQQILKGVDPNSFEIALVAPTGKAALNLQLALEKHQNSAKLQAKTLHSLLELRGESFQEEIKILPYDLILVDEASMIGAEMMARLLASIKTGARVILMGDPYQLPPVEGVKIFSLLLQNTDARVELSQCMRVDREALIQLASDVKQGLPLTSNDQRPLEQVLEEHLPRFTQTTLTSLQKFCILSPLRKGPVGSERINRWILEHLPKNSQLILPIMIATNDHRLQLFNGELGIVETSTYHLTQTFAKTDMVTFSSGKKFPALLLPRFELAFALTVHKSQGSEFDDVLLLLPSQTPCSKELLYTAVTRAKKNLTVWKEK